MAVAAFFAAPGLAAATVISAVFEVLVGLPWSASRAPAQGEVAA